MSKIVKKVFKTIIDVLTMLVFLILILIIFAKVKMMVKGEEYFNMFGYSVFGVASGSMEPEIHQNDMIIIKKSKEYVKGDIVTFKENNAYITHRIITVNENNIITKGDANNTSDVAITKDRIIGKVIKVFSNAGVWHKVFKTPIIIIMIFVTLILFDIAFSYNGNKNKKNVKIVNKIKDIPLEEINKEKDSPKMTEEVMAKLYEKTDKVINGENVKFDKKEQDFLNYTVRLDLDELMSRIKTNIDEDKDA